MDTGLILIVVAAAAVAIAAAVVAGLLRLQRRHSEQLQRVIERLDRLEEAGALAAPASGTTADRDPAEAVDEAEFDTPTGDVLAGMTSHVRRMVEDSEAAPISMADEAIVCAYRHLEAPLTPSALSEELCVSLRSLERGLAASLDCTPRQLIRAVKMREARLMLISGLYNVAEVANRTGFSSPFHFSRAFKDFFGVAPSLMRPDSETTARRQRG